MIRKILYISVLADFTDSPHPCPDKLRRRSLTAGTATTLASEWHSGKWWEPEK